MSWMGCFTELVQSGTSLFSGESEDWEVVVGLLTWEDVDTELVGRVGAATEDGPERAVLVRPPEIPSVDGSLELTGISLCPTEGVTLGAETGEGGIAFGANPNNGGSMGWVGSRGGCTEAGALVKAGEAILEQDSGEEFTGAEASEIPSVDVSLELTGISLCPIVGVNVGAETGEGGLASGDKTNSGGSAGWADSGGGCTGAPEAETEAGSSVEAGAAMLELGPGGEFIGGVAD